VLDRPDILIVDDDERLRRRLAAYLKGEGLDARTAGNGAEMRKALAEAEPDLVVLDLLMPGEDGLTLTRYLREHHDLGIIILTGKGESVDRIVGLEMGADDYVPKPFELRELLARIRSVLRRSGPRGAKAAARTATAKGGGDVLRFADLTLDMAARSLISGTGKEIHLTAAEFNILAVFAANPHRVLDRDRLMDAAGGRDWQPYDRSIDLHVSHLRHKIEEDPKKPRLIKTMRGAGYMFTAEVRRD
jgi:DNA-binding response OmpR family regulator